MYLTITPDCKVKVENIFVDPSGKTQIIQGGTQELFPGIAEVPCFGVHWSYLGSGMVNDHFYEIDSRGEMRQYSVDSTCSHDCLPPGCVLHWKTTDWPDCSWAMKTYQAQSAVRAAFDEAGGIPGKPWVSAFEPSWWQTWCIALLAGVCAVLIADSSGRPKVLEHVMSSSSLLH